ncbi:MAG: hypothetical protein ACRC1F_01150 [Metamycoplasmataceae bacterium]
MNIFLDTTQGEFVACLFDEDFQIIRKTIKTTAYKVEEITLFFDNLLIDKKAKIKDIKNFYINIGPGSFTGSRISLIYVRTIAQISGANIFVTNSFKLLDSLSEDELFISANKNNSFFINKKNIDNITKTTLVKKSKEEKLIDYKNIIANFKSYKNLFTLKNDLLKIKPEYGSTPQIGSVK